MSAASEDRTSVTSSSFSAVLCPLFWYTTLFMLYICLYCILMSMCSPISPLFFTTASFSLSPPLRRISFSPRLYVCLFLLAGLHKKMDFNLCSTLRELLDVAGGSTQCKQHVCWDNKSALSMFPHASHHETRTCQSWRLSSSITSKPFLWNVQWRIVATEVRPVTVCLV